MNWRPLGDTSWIWQSAANNDLARLAEVLTLAAQIRELGLPMVIDLVSSYDTLAAHGTPETQEELGEHLTALTLSETEQLRGRSFEIPVLYDISSELASRLQLTPQEIQRLHSEADYTVAAIGFSPGFPYLLGLPAALHLPRLMSPQRVDEGSVAIAGGQAGIYPNQSHGGWHVLGRTTQTLFHPKASPPALLQPGDRVTFKPVERSQQSSLHTSRALTLPTIVLGDPGLRTSVQSLERTGWQRYGVSPGGCIDPQLAAVTNLLLGNEPDAALLECAQQGPVLNFWKETKVAFLGWDDQRAGRVIEMKTGDTLNLKSARPLASHSYIAFAGGIDVPIVLGRRATDLRAGFGGYGGKVLQANDSLSLVSQQEHSPHSDKALVRWPLCEERSVIRYLPGLQADWFDDDTLARFASETFRISSACDRTGLRLDGTKLAPNRSDSLRSQAVVAGSVQIPPNGIPIVLLAERQTIGGYPQIAHIISADLPLLSRILPGKAVTFRPVTLAEARTAWTKQQRDFDRLRTALSLHPFSS